MQPKQKQTCRKRRVNSNKTGGSPERVVSILKIRHAFPIFITEKRLASVVILATTSLQKQNEKRSGVSPAIKIRLHQPNAIAVAADGSSLIPT
jgi:hypothetical protein